MLKLENGKWVVYVTDERASSITKSRDEYLDEESACGGLYRK
ncbi:hypothetical protein [Clostridium sp. BNL1100]|nr:hypothetical protein [Clostridium sp. BNL1100]